MEFAMIPYISKIYIFNSCFFKPGEPFSQEELDEMYSVAVDNKSKKIIYENYINQLITDIQS